MGLRCPHRMTSEVLAPRGKPRPSWEGLNAATREGLGELGLLLGKAPREGLVLPEVLLPSQVWGWWHWRSCCLNQLLAALAPLTGESHCGTRRVGIEQRGSTLGWFLS